MKQWILALCMFVNLGSAQGILARKGTVIIFEFPKEVQTYVPVTAHSIEDDALKITYLRDEIQARKAVKLIQPSSSARDEKWIRLKIVADGVSYTFDGNGVGLSSEGQLVKIDIKKLDEIIGGW